jgi:hypothetical protein
MNLPAREDAPPEHLLRVACAFCGLNARELQGVEK